MCIFLGVFDFSFAVEYHNKKVLLMKNKIFQPYSHTNAYLFGVTREWFHEAKNIVTIRKVESNNQTQLHSSPSNLR